MVARLEGSRDIDCVVNKLEALNYEVVVNDKKVAYVYRKGVNSSQLRRDINSAKDSCKYGTIIKAVYGASFMNI